MKAAIIQMRVKAGKCEENMAMIDVTLKKMPFMI